MLTRKMVAVGRNQLAKASVMPAMKRFRWLAANQTAVIAKQVDGIYEEIMVLCPQLFG